jgi:hypothetical protein
MTTDPSEYIEQTVDELEYQVAQMESDMNDLVVAFLATFQFDGTELINVAANYERANQSDSVFDEAYQTFIGAFLIYLGKKILDGVLITIYDFSSRGIKPIGNEMKLAEKMIGFVDGKVVKGGYLWNLGKMSVLRSRFHDYIIRAISSAQKLNMLLKNAKPLFVSTDKTRSAFASYYTKYAFDSVQQATNSIALYIANGRGLNTFLYKGTLVKNSRPFCIEHAGNIYTREDAARFELQDWKGKNKDVPFLISVGGFDCQHFLEWLPNE